MREMTAQCPSRIDAGGPAPLLLFHLAGRDLGQRGTLRASHPNGMFALSAPGRLEEVLAAAGLEPREDDDVQSLTVFKDADTALRAFAGAGPTALAIRHSGEEAVADALRHALVDFTDDDGAVRLCGWYRVAIPDVRAREVSP